MTTSRRLLLLLTASLAAACATETTGDDFQVNPPQSTLFVGETVQLTAVSAPREVVWASSISAVASVDPVTGLVTGLSRGTSTISAVAGSDFATAMINVNAQPAIGLSVPEVDFDITAGDPDPAPVIVDVTNIGDGTLMNLAVSGIEYGAGQQGGWLEATLNGTSLIVRARRQGLATGVYTAAVRVTADNAANAPQSLLVTFSILTPASIVLSRNEVPIAGTPGSVVNATVDITNGGGRPLTGLTLQVTHAGGVEGWLSGQLSGTSAPATLTLTAATGLLPVGQYAALVIIGSTDPNVQARNIQVFLTVTPGPAIGLSRTSVPFSAITGGGNPPAQTVTITNAGGGNLSGLVIGAPVYTAGMGGWLATQLSGTTAPATLTLNVNAAGLANGTYTATVAVMSALASNSPLQINVTLSVGPAGMMVVTPNSLTFGIFQNGTNPPVQSVAVTNSGGGTISGLNVNITYGPGASGWLATTFLAGNTTAPASLRIQPNTTSLGRGNYSATVEVRSTTPGVASRTVTVNYIVYTFGADVLPYFQTAVPGASGTPCINCHFSGGQAPVLAGSATTVRSALVPSRVTPGNDNVGALVCKIEGTCGTTMTLPGLAVSLIKLWIRSGAPN
jgi:hypothetical protein